MGKKYTKHPLRHFYSILPIIRFQNPTTPMISNIDTQRDVKRLLRGRLRGTPRGWRRQLRGTPRGRRRQLRGTPRGRLRGTQTRSRGPQAVNPPPFFFVSLLHHARIFTTLRASPSGFRAALCVSYKTTCGIHAILCLRLITRAICTICESTARHRLRQHSICKKNTKHTLRHFYYILPIIRFQNPRTPMISKIDTRRAVKRPLRGR